MMRECICCQCAESHGQFKNYVRCSNCELFGSVDQFSADAQGECCNNCCDTISSKSNEEGS